MLATWHVLLDTVAVKPEPESPVQLDDNRVLLLEVMLHIYLLNLHQQPPSTDLSCAPKDLSSTSLLQILACPSHII